MPQNPHSLSFCESQSQSSPGWGQKMVLGLREGHFHSRLCLPPQEWLPSAQGVRVHAELSELSPDSCFSQRSSRESHKAVFTENTCRTRVVCLLDLKGAQPGCRPFLPTPSLPSPPVQGSGIPGTGTIVR